MLHLAGNKEKCKLKPIFQSYVEEIVVYFEEIDLRESTDCVINGYYDKEKEIHILL